MRESFAVFVLLVVSYLMAETNAFRLTFSWPDIHPCSLSCI